MPLLVHAAAHGGGVAGDDLHGEIQQIFHQRTCPGVAGHFPQNLIFQMLNFCIEFSHNRHLAKIVKKISIFLEMIIAQVLENCNAESCGKSGALPCVLQ